MKTITKKRADKIRLLCDLEDKFLRQLGKRYLTPEDQKNRDLFIGGKLTNEMRSQLEHFEFLRFIPYKYTLYVSSDLKNATTWTGEKLGNVVAGREYRDNFGGIRVPITVNALNGMIYHGTFFKSAGDYATIKLSKKSHNA